MYGLINVPIARLSKHPNQECELLDEVLYGSHVKILEELVNYCIIKTAYSYYGLIRKQDLSILGEKIDHNLIYNGIVTKPFVDVLHEPKYQSHPIITIPKGSYLKIIEKSCNNGWQEVELVNQKRGYIRSDWFKKRCELKKTDNEEKLRDNIVNNAKSYLDTQYRWGGKTIQGIDCSGLTSISYLLEEIKLHRDANIDDLIIEKYKMKRITKEELKPADLLYAPGHIMMYIGNNKYIHASGSSSCVLINSLDPSDALYRKMEITDYATIFVNNIVNNKK
ncbi:MAG: glycoside hydrolase [Haloplasmataceae bacterium]|jgi:beta-lactamase class A|nr:glycoside hydrolase [Haloplasmataceae bacterium]